MSHAGARLFWAKSRHADLDADVTVLVAAVGTGAGLMGTADGLAGEGASSRIIALKPLRLPLLTTGEGVSHRVEGVGFEPPFPDRDQMDDIRAINRELAFDMCRKLAGRAGIFCGGGL